MSGVCAVLGGAPEGGRAALDAMVAAAPQRASAGGGAHHRGRAALAQLLRVGDPNALTAPAVHPETGVAVVGDLRLDNREVLRGDLGGDAPPADVSDTMLVLAAYLRWGLDSLPRLLGDFAIVVWDPRADRLVCARDPMAMRPLYHARLDGRLLVASEIAQILTVPGVPRDLDDRMVAAYLVGCFGPLERTFYAAVAQIPPSHALVVEGDHQRVQRFWDVDPGRVVEVIRPQEAAEELRAVFVQAVRARLRGPRPAGVLLSGGLDSSAAASTAGFLIEQEQASSALHAYSWAFTELTQCDERHLSRHVVDRYGIDATDIPADGRGPLAGYPDHAPDVDEPFHGHFQTLLDTAFGHARNDGVGPLFTGMRGDLVVGPTDEDYDEMLRARRVRPLVDEIRRHHRAGGASYPQILREGVWPVLGPALRRRLPHRLLAGRPTRPAGGSTAAAAAQPTIPPWVAPELVESVDLGTIIRDHSDVEPPPLAGALRRRRYQWIFMPMHLRWAVTHERRVSRYGLQAVDAWSDRRVAELCLSLPQQVIVPPLTYDKPLAREAMRGLMPERLRRSADKILPGALYRETLRTRAQPVVRELLTDSRAAARGYLRAEALLDSYEQFLRGGPPAGQLWWALSLEWWLRELGDEVG